MGYKLKRIMMRPNGVEKQVRPTEPGTIIMSMADIDEQSEFEADGIVPSSLVVVSGTNPITYGYSSYKRFWGGKTKIDVSFPTKGEMYIDGIFGTHNYNSESFLGLFTSEGWLGLQQGTITVSTSTPKLDYPGGEVNPTSVDFMDGNRHTHLITWDNGVYNAWIDGTQIATNIQGTAPSSNSTFRFAVFGGSANGIITKSIYDFYIKDLT